MSVLFIVPRAHLRQLRRTLVQGGDPALVVTLPGLTARILKEGLVSYHEDKIMEELAVWQSVRDLRSSLDYFAPIAQFKGFIQELKWLYNQLDLGEDLYSSMPAAGKAELERLHRRYHEILAELGVLTGPGQLRRALELVQKQEMLPEVKEIKLYGLGELSPLENEFIRALAQGRSWQAIWPQVKPAEPKVIKAPDPAAEVEMIGQALRERIAQGVPLDRLGVAFPNVQEYLPLIIPTFAKLKIPWRAPGISLRNTPLGKAVLTLIAGQLENWQKHHLELLTAPGWGFPFELSPEEQRLLRTAPPVKGLPAWRSRLGQASGWERVFQLLSKLEGELKERPLAEYGTWLEELLEQLVPERWITPDAHLEVWAELVKAWDGMQKLAWSLQRFSWRITPEELLTLLQVLLDSYEIQAKRVFAEQVHVLGVEQVGAHIYQELFAGGLVEGQFPKHRHAHWLTKTSSTVQQKELYERLRGATEQLHLYYPEVDRGGRLNLPATILPEAEDDGKTAPELIHRPSLFFGRGELKDGELVAQLRERILQKGLSVSQLNLYASCPYRFFCSFVLELEVLEEESLELDARQRGIIVHQVLHQFWKERLEGPLPEVAEAQGQIEALLYNAYQAEGASPSASLVRALRSFIRKDLLWAEQGFRPAYLEREFEGLSIPTRWGSISLRGRIDRIDLHPDGAYVLYDYKTGSAPSSGAMLDGEDVQIAAYLLASRVLLPEQHNVGAAYYLIGDSSRKGIFHDAYIKQLGVRRGKSTLAAEAFQEQHQRFQEILGELLEKMLEGRFPIEPASSHVCSYCSYQGICRREVGL